MGLGVCFLFGCGKSLLYLCCSRLRLTLLPKFTTVVPGIDLGSYAFSLQPLVLLNTETKSTRVRLAGDSKLGNPC